MYELHNREMAPHLGANVFFLLKKNFMILFYASTELGTLVSFPMYIFFEIRSQFMNFDRLSGTWTRIYSEACRNHGPGLRKEKSHRKAKPGRSLIPTMLRRSLIPTKLRRSFIPTMLSTSLIPTKSRRSLTLGKQSLGDP